MYSRCLCNCRLSFLLYWIVKKTRNRYNIANLDLYIQMAMTETKRQAKVFSPLVIKIVQKKRGVVSFSKNLRATWTMNGLLKNCEVSLVRTRTLDGDADACRIPTIACRQENNEVVLIIGFYTTGKGHKKIGVTVHSKCQ